MSRKKLTNHNRLFFSHLTMTDQFLAAYDLRLYCTGFRAITHTFRRRNSKISTNYIARFSYSVTSV